MAVAIACICAFTEVPTLTSLLLIQKPDNWWSNTKYRHGLDMLVAPEQCLCPAG